jgi:hypothetical protein
MPCAGMDAINKNDKTDKKMKQTKILNKAGIIIALIFALVLTTNNSYAEIYVGVVDGYVTNLTGSAVNGATVGAEVQGCSAGCTGSTTTDVNGYYVINNLNIATGNTINANASLGNFYGNDSGIGDTYYTAQINITVAQVPSTPTLTTINDTHNNSLIMFIWTNYTDPQGLATYNQWIFDGTTYTNVSSPQNKTDVSFEEYTWIVRTCNAYGCSAWASDTFNVSNVAPPTPSIPDLNNTNQNTITFTWTSGGADPDGDTTYFKFYIDGSTTSGATSPRVLTLANGSHTWKVQECDTWVCSNWAVDTFTIQNNAPSAPNLTAMNATSATSKNFYWTSGADPDADATYDEFQFDNETIVSPAISGLTQALSGTFYYSWRVRTCDVLGSCSAWSEDSFVKFTCAEDVPSAGVPGGSGGGGGMPGGVIVPPKKACNESWHCTAWTPCSPRGQQQRACQDWGKCGTRTYQPIEMRACTPEHCFNGKKDAGEERKDCGGRCKPCEAVYPEQEMPEIELPYPLYVLGLLGIDVIYLIIGLAIGLVIILITILTLMKYSDHFNLYIKLRLVHLQIDFGSKKQAFSEYYERVQPHYKRLEGELQDEMLDNEIRRLNTKARIRLGKIRLKMKKR